MAVHPLYASDKGDEKERGKKPLTKGWRNHTAAEVTDDYLQHHFGNGSNHNIGIVVRAPFVHIDLDSKPDAGESVRAWLAMQTQLAGVPRERTGGGAHLAFICHDLPESVTTAKKAITTQVNSNVTAELYTGHEPRAQPVGPQDRHEVLVGGDRRHCRGVVGAAQSLVWLP